MIQINLLPDVKRDYLRAQQTKHMVMVVAVLVTLAAAGLSILLLAYVQVVQPRHLKNVQSDIDTGISELKNTEDAVKIVTTQGVLEQIPKLQDKKLITSELFGYLNSFTPRDVSYSEVSLNLETNTITLSGQTTTLERANVLANNLKSAKFMYKTSDSEQTKTPFSNIVFTSLGKTSQNNGGKSVAFQIGFTIDPIMFAESTKEGRVTTNATSEELLLPTAQPFSEGGQQ